MARKKPAEEKDPELDMSSLIDVSFLLLIYFIVTSTLDPTEADLNVTMPTSQGGGEPVEIDQMTIEVNSSGHIVVNDEVLDTDASVREVPMLRDRLITYRETADVGESEPMVIISANDAAKGQRFIDVLNALADPKVHISKVTISGFKEE